MSSACVKENGAPVELREGACEASGAAECGAAEPSAAEATAAACGGVEPEGVGATAAACNTFGTAADDCSASEPAAAEPAVSVVVPVYKAEATLQSCLDSILGQTVANIEVVCVNDGSPDGCAAILAAAAERDSRVRVLTQENAGVSAARNAGIDAARGRIVMFADSDDTYEPGACERVAEAFRANPALEAFVFGVTCDPEEAAPKHVRDLLSPGNATFVRDELGRVDPKLFFGACAQPYAVRSAFTRDLLVRENVRFPEGLALAEDAVFQILAYSLASETRLVPDKLYRYRMESGSATHAFNAEAARERKIEQHLVAIGALLGEWRRRGLAAFYGPETVTWCLDLLLFDIARVEPAAATRFAARLAGVLAETFGPAWAKLPPKPAVRRACRAVEAAGGGAGFSLGRVELVAFFLSTRGLKQCVERFL